MTCAGTIVTLGSSDYYVRGSYPLRIGLAGLSERDIKATVSVYRNNILVFTDTPSLSIDYISRLPSNMFVSTPDLEAGDYTVIGTLSSGNQATTTKISIRVFDPIENIYNVTDQTSLNAALAEIKSEGYVSAKILIPTGSFTYPSGDSYDLSESDCLVVFESSGDSAFALTTPVPIKWAKWYSCSFTHPGGSAFASISGSRHVFSRCRFHDSIAAILANPYSNVRVEDCSMDNVGTGLINVSVVRGLSWFNVTNVVFQNCTVVESTSGYRPENTNFVANDIGRRRVCWTVLDDIQTNVSIRNNLLLDDYSTILRSDKSVSNLLMVGNVLITSCKDAVIFNAIANSAIGQNTFETPQAPSSVIAKGNASNNYVINNWMRTLDGNARRLADSGTWIGNASGSSVSFGTHSLTSIDPQFENNYKFLKSTSSLRTSAVTPSSINMLQGILYKNQVGALPYHPDSQLSAYYLKMRIDTRFSFAMPSVVTV